MKKDALKKLPFNRFFFGKKTQTYNLKSKLLYNFKNTLSWFNVIIFMCVVFTEIISMNRYFLSKKVHYKTELK